MLAVKLNVQQPACRWYSGAGLYRDVWLIETAPVHVAMWGNLRDHSASITRPERQVRVQTTDQNDGARAADRWS